MAIQVRNVRKRFGNVEALDEVSLTVGRGEFVSLLGPSGCGKSTLLAMFAGLETPTAGTVEVEGPVGMVFQEPALFPWRTVRDNIAFGLEMAGVAKGERRERADALLNGVHLNGFGDAFPHELSGGMRQRAAIARALAQRPSLLLMDEPFGALDAQTRSLLQEDLRSLWLEYRPTIVFVTHDIEEALLLSDRIVLFSARPGRILEEFTITSPHPRDPQADPDLLALRSRLRTLLAHEIAPVREV